MLETLEGKSGPSGIFAQMDIYGHVRFQSIQHPYEGPPAGRDGDFAFIRRH